MADYRDPPLERPVPQEALTPPQAAVRTGLVPDQVPQDLDHALPDDADGIGRDGEPRRTPLRPLARILRARAGGQDPAAIEAENRARRNARRQDRTRIRARNRLFLLAVTFCCAYLVIGLRMAELAASEPLEPRSGARGGAEILSTRAEIVDRDGRLLAKNLPTNALYAHPHEMIEPKRAAAALVEIFPDLDLDRLIRQFTGTRTFVWIKRTVSPEQMQAVHDIGEPGLLFGPREMRLYPNGAVAAHILGGTRFGLEDVHSAEIVGIAGIEKYMETRLRDPDQAGEPLRLSIDLTVQAAMEDVLAGGMALMNAKGATGILMDARSGEIVAMASLPDFDPNDRPAPAVEGDAADSPLFNRAVQGLYELGSTFKTFTMAQVLEKGIATPETMVDTSMPLVAHGHRINDFRNYGPELSLKDVMVKSSNTGTARLAREIGGEDLRGFLEGLGLTEPLPVELIEARGTKPLMPNPWREISTLTVSYGHGMSTSPLHLAAAYAPMINGGIRVTPTLLDDGITNRVPVGPRVITQDTSHQINDMLRAVVGPKGTAKMGYVPGYAVGGKTGTADKPLTRGGGYYEDKVIATFAGGFPLDDPRYVIVVTLDEPTDTTGLEPRRTAGWTAVPVAAQVIRRTAPLLGLRPQIESRPQTTLIGQR